MNWRSRKLQKDLLLNLRWTILPPKFYECLLESVPKNVATYCNGKLSPFPSFFNIDYVFFPIPLENKEWLMLRLELATQHLVMFPGQDICAGEKYRQVVIPRLTKICVYLGAVLVNMRYWNTCKQLHFYLETIGRRIDWHWRFMKLVVYIGEN
ncbi:hypothetical protein HanRHA438_Chr09g0416551 [Helianthus annuus]|nr:hypothetical protein HanIR_Chr09g0435981 [Helianthus annuus]KAJ0889782.1 hypothetical protein HanRHA438_Chr09g0416551 [Helianthus annuus]